MKEKAHFVQRNIITGLCARSSDGKLSKQGWKETQQTDEQIYKNVMEKIQTCTLMI